MCFEIQGPESNKSRTHFFSKGLWQALSPSKVCGIAVSTEF